MSTNYQFEDAWDAGYAAHERGDTLADNPHAYDAPDHDAWEAGYDEARTEASDDDWAETAFRVDIRPLSPRGPVCAAYAKARAADEILLRLARLVAHRGLDILDLFLSDEGEWYLEVGVAGLRPEDDRPYAFRWDRGDALIYEAGDAYEAAIDLVA